MIEAVQNEPEIDVDDPQVFASAQDRAFHRSENYQFLGQELNFTWDAWQAAQFIGIALFKLNPEELSSFLDASSKADEEGAETDLRAFYAGMDADATLCVYLSQCSAREQMKAYRQPDKVRRASVVWAREKGLEPFNVVYQELMGVFSEMLSDKFSAAGQPEDGGANGDGSLGESGAPHQQPDT